METPQTSGTGASPAASTSLPRRLGTIDAGLIVVASMVGAGIFTAAGFAGAGLESVYALLGLWALGGLYSLCGALCYAELGTRFPEAGGEYVYLREAYGRPIAFLSGWISFVAGFSGAIAVFAIALVKYVSTLIPGWKSDEALTAERCAAIGIIALMTAVHCRRLAIGVTVQNVLTGLKVLAIIAFVILGLASSTAGWERLSQGSASLPSLAVLAGCFANVLFAYSGYNAAGYIAEEVRDPRRTLVRALIGGTLIVTVLYLLINLVYALGVPLSEFPKDATIAYRAAGALLGPAETRFLVGAFSILVLASLGANIVTGPRVYFSMARDGLFPWALCGGVNRWGVPQRAVILQGCLASILIVLGTFQTLVYWVTFVINVFSTLAVLSVFVIRSREGAPAGFRIPLYPLPAIVFVVLSTVFSVWLMVTDYTRSTSLYGLTLIAVGIVVYLAWGQFQKGRSLT